jgi:hypothetical protein
VSCEVNKILLSSPEGLVTMLYVDLTKNLDNCSAMVIAESVHPSSVFKPVQISCRPSIIDRPGVAGAVLKTALS